LTVCQRGVETARTAQNNQLTVCQHGVETAKNKQRPCGLERLDRQRQGQTWHLDEEEEALPTASARYVHSETKKQRT